MILFSGANLFRGISGFLQRSNGIKIFSAYIKLDALKSLIEGFEEKIDYVCVRWEPKDFLTGVSDIEIYSYLKDKNISLFFNQRLHAKAILSVDNNCIIGSNNITNKGLNTNNKSDYNYEVACEIDNISASERLFFDYIVQSSTLVTDEIYLQFKDKIESSEIVGGFKNTFSIEISSNDFLTSSLPQSYDVTRLLETYFKFEEASILDQNCLIHDLALFKLDLNINSKDELLYLLKINFKNHPFIKTFCAYLDIVSEMYFGSVKDWIQKNCRNVPTPRKWELTEHTQILYRWLNELYSEKYAIDIPNHSQRIFNIHI